MPCNSLHGHPPSITGRTMEQLHLCSHSLAAPGAPQQLPSSSHVGAAPVLSWTLHPQHPAAPTCHRAMGFAVLMTGIIPHGLAHGPALLRPYSGPMAQRDQEPCRAEAVQSDLSRAWAWLPFGTCEAITTDKTFILRGSHGPSRCFQADS